MQNFVDSDLNINGNPTSLCSRTEITVTDLVFLGSAEVQRGKEGDMSMCRKKSYQHCLLPKKFNFMSAPLLKLLSVESIKILFIYSYRYLLMNNNKLEWILLKIFA